MFYIVEGAFVLRPGRTGAAEKSQEFSVSEDKAAGNAADSGDGLADTIIFEGTVKSVYIDGSEFIYTLELKDGTAMEITDENPEILLKEGNYYRMAVQLKDGIYYLHTVEGE